VAVTPAASAAGVLDVVLSAVLRASVVALAGTWTLPAAGAWTLPASARERAVIPAVASATAVTPANAKNTKRFLRGRGVGAD
jgi:hypothetical protein